jgi:prefoldin subunit 5
MERTLTDTEAEVLEASLAVIDDAGRKLSDALANLSRTRASIEAILRPTQPETGKRWQ